MNVARNFRGNDAQTFIDFLNQVSRSYPMYLKTQVRYNVTGSYTVMPR